MCIRDSYFAILVAHVVRGASDDLCLKHAHQSHSEKKRSLVYLLIVKLLSILIRVEPLSVRLDGLGAESFFRNSWRIFRGVCGPECYRVNNYKVSELKYTQAIILPQFRK